MWSHLGGGEFASGNIWRDIWNGWQLVTQSVFSLFVCFQTIGCRSHFVALWFFLHLIVLHFWLTILISSCLKYLTLPFLICLSFVFLLVSIILSPSVHFPCFSSIYFFFHYSISLFCTTPTLANPLQRLSETFNAAQTWVGADVTAVKKHKLQHVKTRQSTSGRYIVLFIAKWFVWCSPEPKHN